MFGTNVGTDSPCPTVATVADHTNQRLATAPPSHLRCTTAPLPSPRAPVAPATRGERRSCVSLWRRRWRRALPGTVRPVCKTPASDPGFRPTAGPVAACARVGSVQSSSPPPPPPHASRFRDVNKTPVASGAASLHALAPREVLIKRAWGCGDAEISLRVERAGSR